MSAEKKLKQFLQNEEQQASMKWLLDNWAEYVKTMQFQGKLMKVEYDSYIAAGFKVNEALILCKVKTQGYDEKS